MRLLRSFLPPKARLVRVRTEKSFLRRLPRATHVVTWHFRKEWYALAPHLALVATPGAGRELVSEEAPAGVRVHFGGFHGALITETVVGFMLAWSRGFFAVRQAPTGWPRTWLSDKCFTLAGTRAVIVGYGRIGRAIGNRLEQMGVSVTGITRHPPRDLFSQTSALGAADWLIMALPSTTGTDNLLNDRFISKLPRRCVVVNVGRGNAVDEAALLRALRSGRLAGAYLDVCKTEPTAVMRAAEGESIDPLHPQVPNLVLMPHSSAFSPQYLHMCFRELKDEGLI